MSKYSINDTTLDNIAAPIMSMRGLTGGLTPEEMGTNANAVLVNVTDALNAIAAKGVDISGMNSDNLAALIAALATLPALTTPGVAADLRTGKQLIDGSGNIVTGTMPEQAAQTITPGTSDKTIASDRYLTGTQTIKGDSNLVAENIVSGKTIFGVSGSYTGGGKMVNGSFITAGTSNVSKTVTHNLGSTPNLAVVFLDTNDITTTNRNMFMFHIHYKGKSWVGTIKIGYSTATLSVAQTTSEITSAATNGFGSATTSKITFKAQYVPYDENTLGGTTYYYVIGVV